MRRRRLRAAATLLVTGLAVAYILWKVDLGETLHVIANASLGWLLASFAIWVLSVWPLAVVAQGPQEARRAWRAAGRDEDRRHTHASTHRVRGSATPRCYF